MRGHSTMELHAVPCGALDPEVVEMALSADPGNGTALRVPLDVLGELPAGDA